MLGGGAGGGGGCSGSGGSGGGCGGTHIMSGIKPRSASGRQTVSFADGNDSGKGAMHHPETPVKPEKSEGAGRRPQSSLQRPPSTAGSLRSALGFSHRKFGADVGDARVFMTNVHLDAGRPRLPHHHTYSFKNGDTYDGDWRDGMLEGVGRYSLAGGKEWYEGQWEGDKLQGRALHAEPSGFVYEGAYQDGVRHGRARLRIPPQEPQRIIGMAQPQVSKVCAPSLIHPPTSQHPQQPEKKLSTCRSADGAVCCVCAHRSASLTASLHLTTKTRRKSGARSARSAACPCT